jgi:hypothetical protein
MTPKATSERTAPRGITPPSTPGGRPDFLSDVIVELGFADRETVEQAVREARTGTTVSRVLVESGAVTENQLARAMAERYGLDHVDLEEFEVDPAAANLIKPAAAKRYLAVPIGFADNGRLIVAMSDPADALGVNDIAVMTKLDVRPAVAARDAIEALVGRLPIGGAPVAAPPREDPPAGPEAAAGAEAPPAQEPVTADENGSQPEAAEQPPAEQPAPPEPPRRPDPAPPKSAAVFWQMDDDGEGTTSDSPPEAEVEPVEAGPMAEGAIAPAPAEARAREGVIRALREELDAERGARVELARLSAELDGLRERLGETEAELSRARGEADARASELDAARARTATAERSAEDAQRRAAEAAGAADDAQRRLAESERAADDAQRRAAEAERATEEAQRRLSDADRGHEETQRRLNDAEATLEDVKRRLADSEADAEDAHRRAAEAERGVESGQRRLADAESVAEELRRRLRDLEDSDRRAEHARLALVELREETERQREQHAMLERDLRTRIATEERRRRVLEERLSEVEESVFAAERAFEELGLAQRRMRGALRALVEAPGRDEGAGGDGDGDGDEASLDD